MLRERFKEIDLKLTELAEYLQISRPTLYNYMELYDKKKYGQINLKVLGLFNYITENQLAGKRNVINYILTNLVEVEELAKSDEQEAFKKLKKCIVENPDSKKSKFIINCVDNDFLDDVIFYLSDVVAILKKKKRTAQEEKSLAPYNALLQELKTLNNVEG